MQTAKMISAAFLTASALTGCGKHPPPTAVDRLEQQAQVAAEEVAANTLEPYEIENITHRRELFGKPGLVLHVVFLNDMGQPIDYFTSGKCTSSGKRLTPEERLVRGDLGEYTGDLVMKAPSEDGTHGKSDEYVYCFTIDGKYKQWNGEYYLSNYPIELTIKPLVISASGKNQSQQ